MVYHSIINVLFSILLFFDSQDILAHSFVFVNIFFHFLTEVKSRTLLFANGEGGIRTHAPLRTNGFQDRLVMTTSIPLHNLYQTTHVVFKFFILSLSVSDKWYSNTKLFTCQHFFENFFIFFSNSCFCP